MASCECCGGSIHKSSSARSEGFCGEDCYDDYMGQINSSSYKNPYLDDDGEILGNDLYIPFVTDYAVAKVEQFDNAFTNSKEKYWRETKKYVVLTILFGAIFIAIGLVIDRTLFVSDNSAKGWWIATLIFFCMYVIWQLFLIFRMVKGFFLGPIKNFGSYALQGVVLVGVIYAEKWLTGSAVFQEFMHYLELAGIL